MSQHDVMGVQVQDGPKSWPEWQHKFTASKPTGERTRIKVEAGLHYLRGNRLPYFTATGTTYEDGRDVGGGCIHREIIAAWPELAPIVALHLADSDGSPMHGGANGWYWLAGYYGGAGERYHGGNSERQHWNTDGSFNGYRLSTFDECLQVFANLVRIPFGTAEVLAREWQNGVPYDEAKALFLFWVRDQRPRWKAEAEAGTALLDRLIAQQAGK